MLLYQTSALLYVEKYKKVIQKYQLQHGIKNLNYLMNHILNQILKIVLNTS